MSTTMPDPGQTVERAALDLTRFDDGVPSGPSMSHDTYRQLAERPLLEVAGAPDRYATPCPPEGWCVKEHLATPRDSSRAHTSAPKRIRLQRYDGWHEEADDGTELVHPAYLAVHCYRFGSDAGYVSVARWEAEDGEVPAASAPGSRTHLTAAEARQLAAALIATADVLQGVSA